MGGALCLTAQRKDSPRDTGVPTVLRRIGKKQGALGGLRKAREGGRRPRRDKDSGRRVRTPTETARWPTKSPQPLTRTRRTLHHPPRSCFRLLLSASGARKDSVRPRAAAPDRNRKWAPSQEKEAGGRPISSRRRPRGAALRCSLRTGAAARRVAGPRARRHEAVQPKRPV